MREELCVRGEEEERCAGVTMFCCCCCMINTLLSGRDINTTAFAVAILAQWKRFSSHLPLLLNPLSFTFIVGFVMGFAAYD